MIIHSNLIIFKEIFANNLVILAYIFTKQQILSII
jgi:hypothetical protein